MTEFQSECGTGNYAKHPVKTNKYYNPRKHYLVLDDDGDLTCTITPDKENGKT